MDRLACTSSPTINSEYGYQFITGMQGDDPKYLKTSACLKHYAAYSEETNRYSFPAVVTSQDMEDTYIPAFQAGVERANASSIMCSYNAETYCRSLLSNRRPSPLAPIAELHLHKCRYGEGVYGEGTQGGAIPSCANKGLLNDLARDEWHFDGYVTSDCGAVANVYDTHHCMPAPMPTTLPMHPPAHTADTPSCCRLCSVSSADTPNETSTVKAVFKAGMDTDCGLYMVKDRMTRLLADPEIFALADVALKNLFKTQLRLGFADPPGGCSALRIPAAAKSSPQTTRVRVPRNRGRASRPGR